MNGFARLKARLEQDGWYVGWAQGQSQSDGWALIPTHFPAEHPHANQAVDLDKILFNTEQDCLCEAGSDDEPPELPDGLSDEEQKDWWETVYDVWFENNLNAEFIGNSENLVSSLFCFSTSENGMKNLKTAISFIEECGIYYNWSNNSEDRIEIIW